MLRLLADEQIARNGRATQMLKLPLNMSGKQVQEK